MRLFIALLFISAVIFTGCEKSSEGGSSVQTETDKQESSNDQENDGVDTPPQIPSL